MKSALQWYKYFRLLDAIRRRAAGLTWQYNALISQQFSFTVPRGVYFSDLRQLRALESRLDTYSVVSHEYKFVYSAFKQFPRTLPDRDWETKLL